MATEPAAKPREAPRAWRKWFADPRLEALAWALALALFAYVAIYPLCLVRYPPITDLPFHAANTSIVRHYYTPEFGFKEQFKIDAISAPYMSMYLLGAALAWVLPIHVAVKTATVVLLSLLPLGLGILFRGLGKHPLLGVLALGLFYTTLTHWGFISHLGALGSFAGSLGAALLLLQADTKRQVRNRTVLLSVLLLLTLFSHVFRFPFALGGVLLLGAVGLWSGAPRPLLKALLAAMLPGAVLFAWFWFSRSHVLASSLVWSFSPARLLEFPQHLFGGFVASVGEKERALGASWAISAVLLGVGCAVSRRLWFPEAKTVLRSAHAQPLANTAEPAAPEPAAPEPAAPEPAAPEPAAPEPAAPEPAAENGDGHAAYSRRLVRRAHYALAGMCCVMLLLYLSLPLLWGSWFFVYPREALSVVLIALALLPGLPRVSLAPLAVVLLGALTAGRQAYLVAEQWLAFEALNQDFYAVQQRIPARPKLLYLIFDHAGTYRSTTPFIHLPAWIQAEKGGALYFHFVRWGLYPIQYRLDSLETPPVLPYFLEWRPETFRTIEHGQWFDTFLVRHRIDPGIAFEADPSIRFVAREGNWWLYQREPSK